MASRMPVKVISDPAHVGPPTVRLLPGGQAEATWPGYGYQRSVLNDLIREAIRKQINNLLPQTNYYWRATNNPAEINLIRNGTLRRSINHVDGYRETGLSVADHLAYIMAMTYRYGYRIRGEVIGTGNDGEPVLRMESLQPLDDQPRTTDDIRANEEATRRKALREALADIGWTPEHYQASLWAYVEWDD